LQAKKISGANSNIFPMLADDRQSGDEDHCVIEMNTGSRIACPDMDVCSFEERDCNNCRANNSAMYFEFAISASAAKQFNFSTCCQLLLMPAMAPRVFQNLAAALQPGNITRHIFNV
jgi:hypothetical protein